MLKQVVVGAAAGTMMLTGYSATALAKPSGPPPGCQQNGHPYGPPCGPPQGKGDHNCSTSDQDDCPPPPPNNDDHGKGGDHDQDNSGKSVKDKNSALITHQNPATSTAGELGITATIIGVSLAGFIALRKRPSTR